MGPWPTRVLMPDLLVDAGLAEADEFLLDGKARGGSAGGRGGGARASSGEAALNGEAAALGRAPEAWRRNGVRRRPLLGRLYAAAEII